MTELPSADRIELHKLLRAAAEPWLVSPITPVIIGWYQYRSSLPHASQFGMFRLQFGSRAWSTGAYEIGGRKEPIAPKYQASFEQQAIALRKAGWDRLSASLLRPDKPSTDQSAQADAEMFLLIGNQSCYFGVRSASSKQQAYFIVNDAGLEPATDVPKVWFDAWPGQLDPPVFSPIPMSYVPNLRSPADVARHVRWWYQTPLMPADEARERLGDLLKLLFERLSRLGKAVAIATSPHRFNDACGDENWLAAFVDGWLWENGVYFESSAKSLANAPRQLHEAMGLLQEVLKGGVRAKLSEYLGSESAAPDTLILSSDERGHLIALSRSMDNGGPVYRVDPDSGLPSLVGVAPRLDWRFAECGSPGGARVGEAEPIGTSEAETSGAQTSEAAGSSGRIVQFVALAEWIETLGGDEIPFDYPELNHIYSS
ncbi:hypothetical protein [Bradyrhizobium sp. HKCCYLR20261]|uniref:hypothetical protein n=1 Tax=unclassified Bradyrhizobium TaxID=2631580 RepID=UPI003EB9CDE3